MSKKINFYAQDEFIYSSTKPYSPSRQYIPDWYKNSKAWRGGDKYILDLNNMPQKDVKLCVPYLDSLTSGYTLELWCDILIKQEETGPVITWFDQSHPPVRDRNRDVAQLVPTPLGCHPNQYTWNMPWGIKTPLGYSTLSTHPLNRYDLPFITLTGIVDNDQGIAGGNHPVYFSNTFEGIIPAGTPIVQIIPFKREDWESKTSYNPRFYRKMSYSISKAMYGAYKRTMWHKKKFD